MGRAFASFGARRAWWAIAAVAVALPASAQPRIAPDVAVRAAAGESVRVLVELDVPFAPEGRLPATQRGWQRSAIASAQAGLAASLAGRPHRVVRGFRTLPGAALEVGAAALDDLARSPLVLRVTADDLHAPLLDLSIPVVQADQAAGIGADGSGRAVVVIDTGVDAAHPNLVGKVVAEACFASGAPGPSGDCPNGSGFQSGPGSGTYCTFSSECFHGTHVAGIAAGDGPRFDGVARGADLIAIRVASEITDASACSPSPAPCARSYESDLIAALEEVYEELRFDWPIAAVNLSLGGAVWTSQPACDAGNAVYKAVIDNLRSAGIATVAAAGNDGVTDGIAEPACISSAVSVSASNDTDGVASFANRAPFLSLWAPGVAIRAPLYETTGYANASGTSMAAPHVAGAWAILHGARPDAGVDEVLGALQATGAPMPHTSRIRIRAALDALTVACANGLDDDGDGFVDAAQDPGCAGPAADDEDPDCQDGADNDLDGSIDFDGGASRNGGVPIAASDPHCKQAWTSLEKYASCGLGVELVLLVAALRLRRRAR
jgi:subtilisin family serine protease